MLVHFTLPSIHSPSTTAWFRKSLYIAHIRLVQTEPPACEKGNFTRQHDPLHGHTTRSRHHTVHINRRIRRKDISFVVPRSLFCICLKLVDVSSYSLFCTHKQDHAYNVPLSSKKDGGKRQEEEENKGKKKRKIAKQSPKFNSIIALIPLAQHKVKWTNEPFLWSGLASPTVDVISRLWMI